MSGVSTMMLLGCYEDATSYKLLFWNFGLERFFPHQIRHDTTQHSVMHRRLIHTKSGAVR